VRSSQSAASLCAVEWVASSKCIGGADDVEVAVETGGASVEVVEEAETEADEVVATVGVPPLRGGGLLLSTFADSIIAEESASMGMMVEGPEGVVVEEVPDEAF